MLNARKTDPSTSHAAMKRISGNAKDIERAIWFFGSEGATCNQLRDYMGLPRDSISPCMPKLEKMCYVERTGCKRLGEQVWIHKEHADVFHPRSTDKKIENRKKVKTKKELQEELQALKIAHYTLMRKAIGDGDGSGTVVEVARHALSNIMAEQGFEGY